MSQRVPNNRHSTIQKRNRRTTVMSGKNINDIIQEDDQLLAESYKEPMFKSVIIEETKEELIEQQKEDEEQVQARASFQPSFSTPPDENNEDFFDDDSLKRHKRDREEEQKETLKLKRAVRSVKARKVEMDILEQLEGVEKLEEEIKNNSGAIEQNMDELLEAAESLNENRQKSSIDETGSFYYQPRERRLTPTNQDIKEANARKNKRFSIEFEDGDLKTTLTKSQTSKNGMGKSFEIPSMEPQLYSIIETKKSNKDSLDSDEDLENYQDILDELLKQAKCQQYANEQNTKHQIEQQRLKDLKCTCHSYSWINKRFLNSKCELHDEDQIKIEAVKMKRKDVDMFDAIEEIENDGEEQLWDSDDSFSKEFYQTMHHGVLVKTMDEERQRKVQRLAELTKEDWDYKDQIKIIEWNENRYQDEAIEELKKHSELSIKKTKTSDIKQSVLSGFSTMNTITQKMIRDKQALQVKPTAVAINNELIFVGNSDGELWMFKQGNEEDYACFIEGSKEFKNNPITAIDVHPLKLQYVVVGYEQTQIVLIDVRDPKKALKIIKDNHKCPIINIKFCDWTGGRTKIEDNKDESQETDMDAWMFISMDQSGKIIINTVTKLLFLWKASKFIAIDPSKTPEYSAGLLHQTISCRFQSKFHGQGIYDDMAIGAVGNEESVIIFEARANKFVELYKILRPQKFYNTSTKQLEDIKPVMPQLSWGFGMSPVLKDRSHSILAIAWGPLIQLVVFIDNEDTDTPFILDGYYILKFGESHSSQSLLQAAKGRKSVRFEENQVLEMLKNIQIQNNQGAQRKSKEDLDIELKDADTKSFTKPEMNIQQIMFISDSILLVLTSNLEVRVLYTQSFSPESYAPEKPENRSFMNKHGKEVPPQIEAGFKVPNLVKLDHSQSYDQSLKFYNGKIIALTQYSIQSCTHLTWQQSIHEFMKKVDDDLKKVFSRALSFYKGKVKGYSGIPDIQYVREKQIKTELKALVKDIIKILISKVKQDTTAIYNRMAKKFATTPRRGGVTANDMSLDIDSMTAVDANDEIRSGKLEVLMRCVIEFCMILKDCDFLFDELFKIFLEEKIDDVFIQELEIFIMGGDFQDWELPNDIIQNHLIKYYNKPGRIEALEKIIINLNLAKCPKTIILEFVHFSEQYYLTTALLYLYTHVFEKKDNTACIQVLFSLFDLYVKHGKSSKLSTEIVDLKALRDPTCGAQQKRDIEKSSKYLGYKILWALKLFLNGKKFPKGEIRERRWRTYIHDIIQFLSNQEILKTMLDIDAESLFQTISILFYQSKPNQLLLAGRDSSSNNLPTISAGAFIKKIDSYCLSFEAPTNVKSQYLYFAANVISKSLINELDSDYYYNISRELLSQFRNFLEFNRHLNEMSFRRKKKVQMRLENQGIFVKNTRTLDQIKHIYKTENDLMTIIKKSEPLDNIQLSDLLKLAENTQFNQIKIFLLERKEEFIKCLLMLLSNFKLSEALTVEQQGEEILYWIREKITLLEQRSSKSIIDKNNCEHFKREVAQNINKIVAYNSLETVKLVEEKFGGNHKEMIDSLNREPIEQMYYLDSFVELYDNLIEDTITNYGLKSTNIQEAKRYIEFLKLHLNLCCQYQQDKVQSIVEKIVKNSYYPIQECLEICQKYEMIEATFILTKKLGKYYDSVSQGLALLKEKVDMQKIKVELYFAKVNGINVNFCQAKENLPEIHQFDSKLKRLFKICKKNSREVEKEKEELIWYILIDTLLDMRSDPNIAKKTFCALFFQERLIIFIEQMIRAVPIKNFLLHIFDKTYDILFKDLRGIFQDVFYKMNQEQIVLGNANNSIFKVNQELFQQFSNQSRRGILFRQRICGCCKRYQDSFLYEDLQLEDDQHLDFSLMLDDDDDDETNIYDSSKELIKIFACRHTFHIRCLEKHYREKNKDVKDLFSKKGEKQLRCPTCNLKDYDIMDSDMGTKSMKPAIGTKSNGLLSKLYNKDDRKQTVPPSKQPSHQTIEERIEQKQQMREMKMTMISQTMATKQLFKISKKMNFYETQKANTWLTINDFKI